MSRLQEIMAAVVAMCGLAQVPAPPGQQPPPLPPGWTIASAVKPSPPEVQPAGCRCDILEKKLAALTDRLDRLERQLGWPGGGRDDAQPATTATPGDVGAGAGMPQDVTAPLVTMPGTNKLGHGPYMSKIKPAGDGQWWSYKRCYGGNTCQMEYYWVPEK